MGRHRTMAGPTSAPPHEGGGPAVNITLNLGWGQQGPPLLPAVPTGLAHKMMPEAGSSSQSQPDHTLAGSRPPSDGQPTPLRC